MLRAEALALAPLLEGLQYPTHACRNNPAPQNAESLCPLLDRRRSPDSLLAAPLYLEYELHKVSWLGNHCAIVGCELGDNMVPTASQ
ncbi:Uncharacterised protein [Chlamydia trachomatis]|nr:Uncharacterised protein [Chlamydia trachomatis]